MDIYQSMPSIAAMQEQSAKRKRGDDDEEQAGASADQAVVVRTIPETYAAMHCEEDGVGLTTVVAVAEEVPQTDNSSQRDREAAELLLFLPGAPEAPDSGAEGRAGAGAGSSSSAPLPSTRMLPRASAADVAAAIGGRASGKLVAAPEPTPGGAHPWLRLLACEHEYNLPDYPLALANATATSGDAGHVYLTMSMRDPKDEAVVVRPSEPMRLHAALLVETNDERWPTLHMLPPSHLAHYWSEQHRQKCFTYLCNPRGQPAGLAGWNTFMKADFPQSLPDGACPGTWTHVEGRKIALMPYPWTVSSGAYERNQKWNTLGGREFRVLVYAEDMVRFPHAVCTTEPFRILKRSTLNNNKGKVVDMKPKFTLPLGPMRPPEPPARVEKDGPPKGTQSPLPPHRPWRPPLPTDPSSSARRATWQVRPPSPSSSPRSPSWYPLRRSRRLRYHFGPAHSPWVACAQTPFSAHPHHPVSPRITPYSSAPRDRRRPRRASTWPPTVLPTRTLSCVLARSSRNAPPSKPPTRSPSSRSRSI